MTGLYALVLSLNFAAYYEHSNNYYMNNDFRRINALARSTRIVVLAIKNKTIPSQKLKGSYLNSIKFFPGGTSNARN